MLVMLSDAYAYHVSPAGSSAMFLKVNTGNITCARQLPNLLFRCHEVNAIRPDGETAIPICSCLFSDWWHRLQVHFSSDLVVPGISPSPIASIIELIEQYPDAFKPPCP